MFRRLTAALRFTFLALTFLCLYMALQEINRDAAGSLERAAGYIALALAALCGFFLGARESRRRMDEALSK